MSKQAIINDLLDLAKLSKHATKDKEGNLIHGFHTQRAKAFKLGAEELRKIPGNIILSIVRIKKGKQRPDGTGNATRTETYITTDKKNNYLTPKGIIGEKQVAKINQFLDTGEMKAAVTARQWLEINVDKKSKSRVQIAQEKFTKIHSIRGGAKLLAQAYIRSKSSLDPIEWLKGNKIRQNLTKAQKISLRYYEDTQKRMERRFITIIQLMIRIVLSKVFGLDSFKMEVVGSYQRGAKDSKDIDILLTSKKFSLSSVIYVLANWGIIVEKLTTEGSKNFYGIGQCPSGEGHYFRLDIFFVPENEWAMQLYQRSQSKDFMINLRNSFKQLKLGYKLSDGALLQNKILVTRDPKIMEKILKSLT